MKTRTSLKAGGMANNHNEAAVRDSRGLKVRTCQPAEFRESTGKCTWGEG